MYVRTTVGKDSMRGNAYMIVLPKTCNYNNVVNIGKVSGNREAEEGNHE